MVSYAGGEASMIRLRYDEATDEYGLHLYEATDENGDPTLDTVVEPFDDTHGETGVDWTQVAPEWLTQEGHGTVLVLLGNSLGGRHHPRRARPQGERDEGRPLLPQLADLGGA